MSLLSRSKYPLMSLNKSQHVKIMGADALAMGEESFYFFYNGRLRKKEIRRSLKRAINSKIPIAASVGKIVNEKTLVELREFNIKFHRGKISDWVYNEFAKRKSHLKKGFLIPTYLNELDSLVYDTHSINENGELWVVVEDRPLITITLLETKRTNKTILCLSFNHMISDLYSIILLMECWTKENKSRHGPAKFRRSFAGDPSNFDLEKADPDLKRRYEPYLPKQDVKNDERDDIPPEDSVKNHCYAIIHLTKERLTKMKSEAMEKYGFNVSSFNCTCAYLAKLYVIKEVEGEDEMCRFAVVVNLRYRKGVKNMMNYFGNLCVNPSFVRTKKEILEMDYPTLAKLFLDIIKPCNMNDIRFVNNCHPLRNGTDPFFGKNFALFDDWRSIRRAMDDLHFGNVKCENFMPAVFHIGRLELEYIYLEQADDGGIVSKLPICKSLYHKIREWKINLSDEECLEFLLKKNKDIPHRSILDYEYSTTSTSSSSSSSSCSSTSSEEEQEEGGEGRREEEKKKKQDDSTSSSSSSTESDDGWGTPLCREDDEKNEKRDDDEEVGEEDEDVVD